MQDVCSGIKELFNSVLSEKLLYNIERPQFDERVSAAGGDQQPSEVYGTAHLLRLMARINGLMNMKRIGGDADGTGGVELVSEVLRSLLVFLDNNRRQYFTSKNYVAASDDYLEKVNAMGVMDEK